MGGTDSPAVRAPLDPKEQPILDRVLAIRDELSLLKQDRSTYVRSQDVMSLYKQVIEQVEKLNDIRTHKRTEQNRGIELRPRRLVQGIAMLITMIQWIPCSTTASSSYRSSS